MAKLNVNIGLSVNDKTGDTLRTAFDKINQNFTELYTLTGGTSTALTELAQDYAAPLFNHASHTNITVTYDDANNKILLTGTPAQVQSNWTASSGLGVILNKPTLFSGSYTDLTGTPTIPAAAAWPVTNTSGASGPTKVAIGQKAGDVTQGYSALAIGANAGETSQGNSAVAIGEYTGTTNQGDYAVAVGRSAGYTAQGANAVAIGRLAGYSSQPANTIILNATAVAVNGVSSQTNSFYVAPVRSATATANVVYYNTTTKEITYAAAGSVSSLVNGARTLSLGSDGTVTLPNFDILAGIGSKIKSALDIKIQAGAYYLSNLIPLYAEPFTIVFSISSAPDWATVVAVGDYVISGTCVMQITVVAAPNAGEWRITLSTTDFTGASDINGNSSWSFYKPGATNSIWTFGKDGKLTAPGNLQIDGGKIILNSAGNAYVESVDYGVNSANSAVNIFGGPYQKIKLRAGFGTEATWTLGTDGVLTLPGNLKFPNATVQTTAWTGGVSSLVNSTKTVTLSTGGTLTANLDSALGIQTSKTLTTNLIIIDGQNFVTERYVDAVASVIPAWSQRNSQQIEINLFVVDGSSTYTTLIGLPLGRVVIVTYQTASGNQSFTTVLSQQFTAQGQYDQQSRQRLSGRIDGTLPVGQTGIYTLNFPTYSTQSNTWNFDTYGKLTAPGNLQVDGGKIILNSAGNAYVESVDYGVNSANSAVNIFGGPYQKIKLRAGFGTEATWTLGTDGSLTLPDASVIASYKPVTVIAQTTTTRTITDQASAAYILFAETVDTANAYANGVFTAPYTGYYQFNVSIYFSTSVTLNSGSFFLIDSSDSTKRVTIMQDAWSGRYLHYSTVVQATAGDTISCFVLRNASGANIELASDCRLTIHRVSIS